MAASPASLRLVRAAGGRELTLLAGCLLTVLVFSLASPYFLLAANLATIMRNSVELLIIGLGMTFVLAIGGIDVSVGLVMGLGAIGVGQALLAGLPLWLVVLIGPLCGTLIGAITGSVIVFGRIPAIVATIGLLGIYRTAIYALLGGSWLSGLPTGLTTLVRMTPAGVPLPVIVILLLYLLAYLLLRWTPFGLHILAVGQDEARARLAGVAVRRVRFLAYLASGCLCGIAAVSYVGTYRNVEMTTGASMSLDAIAAVVLGGTSILGGRASLLGTLLGVVLLRMLVNGFTLIGVPSLWQSVVTGVLLLAALIAENLVSGQIPWHRLRRGAA
ncbi:ABC transporter permease [Acidisoma cellulosilytica]|uniref:Autoinducer 2 import system permease protein LsrC n=1 Tax=Acidisoma cellulosilyticum TaxID=2802395 RepID=A0A964E6J6_9PROT|nr:ABC transporter permease [Acidisoma cellulosilyticum]MCB8883532.1 ABC transporter permease [Acidisoma cellulosilyticum]